ncbi:MAG: hypothetical protein GYA87_08670 [Christensenellaceae bacterium]|nr:hypothetical protein [Christensenellaceae bacterium]
MAESGTYKVVFFVKDKYGKIKTKAVDGIVYNLFDEPIIVDIIFRENRVYLGERFYVMTDINNGYAANIAYNVYKDGALYYKSNFRSIANGDGRNDWVFKPNHLGKYTVEAVIRSATGEIISKTTANFCDVLEK